MGMTPSSEPVVPSWTPRAKALQKERKERCSDLPSSPTRALRSRKSPSACWSVMCTSIAWSAPTNSRMLTRPERLSSSELKMALASKLSTLACTSSTISSCVYCRCSALAPSDCASRFRSSRARRPRGRVLLQKKTSRGNESVRKAPRNSSKLTVPLAS